MEIYPVVHVNKAVVDASTRDVAIGRMIEQAELALDYGADGVFLIDHYLGGSHPEPVFKVINALKEYDQRRFVGLNLLGLGPEQAMMRIALAQSDFEEGVTSRGAGLEYAPDGIWIDDMKEDRRPSSAMKFKSATQSLADTAIFGGVAFKYRPTWTDNPEAAAREALELASTVDVVTTSGKGTGYAAPPEKLEAMKRVLVGKPLALASGVSIENIAEYQGLVDKVLVSSSIETAPQSGEFIEPKLRDLIQAAKSLAV